MTALAIDREVVRVLHRFTPRTCYNVLEAPLVGLYLDLETTSLNTDEAQVIEFAAVRFEFSSDGRIGAIRDSYAAFEDPGIPIPAEVTKITGITDDDVRGQRIDDARVEQLAHGAALVIAHNAAYDRPIAQRRFPIFASMRFACSYREVDWQAFGCECSKLSHILMLVCGEVPERKHRALDDCYAGVHALATAQLDERPAMAYLLDSAREPTLRIWATRAPFEYKDKLKARGYRWNDKERTWYRDIKPSEELSERAWLVSDACVRMPHVERLTARERYAK